MSVIDDHLSLVISGEWRRVEAFVGLSDSEAALRVKRLVTPELWAVLYTEKYFLFDHNQLLE